eukprot:9866801-Lingulodinium_polyedra.AAC.1
MVLPPTVFCGPSRHALACLVSVRGASASAPEVRGSARPTVSAPSNPGSEIGRGVPTDEAARAGAPRTPERSGALSA